MKGSWFNLKVTSQYLAGKTEEKHENLNQDSQSLGRYLNPGPREYEAGVLTTQTTTLGLLHFT
jgi:hypothetical protein